MILTKTAPRKGAGIGLIFLALSFLLPAQAKKDPLLGRWSGLFTGNGPALDFELNIIEAVALFSVPSQELYGLPITSLKWTKTSLEVIVSESEPRVALSGRIEKDAIRGDYLRDGQAVSLFSMKPSALPGREGLDYSLNTVRGRLPGTLLLPDAKKYPGKNPVVLILADSGPSDRDGNVYSVPGKNDCLLLLAQALSQQGLASLRYDKRGAGESYVLAPKEEDLIFADFVLDAQAAIRALKADKRFSKVVVIGHGQGSLVGSSAAAAAGAAGFVSLAGVGLPSWQTIQSQLEHYAQEDETTAGLKLEWERLISELRQGRRVAYVNPDLESMFRPSIQPFLISWFSFDPKTEISKFSGPVLIIQGGNDSRVGPDDTRALEEGKPGAKEVFLPDMNHVLKATLPTEADNEASYSDPRYPLASGLMTVIRDFVQGL